MAQPRDRRADMGGPRLQAVRREPPRRMAQVGVADEILEPARRSRSGGRLTSRRFTYSRSNVISTGGVSTSAA